LKHEESGFLPIQIAYLKGDEMSQQTPEITRLLGTFVAQHPSAQWPQSVDDEAHRSFANWLGCAIGASQHETLQTALRAVLRLLPAAQSTVLGIQQKVDMCNAAFLNGLSAHTFDFDDTHWRTIIHPAAPVSSALLALAEVLGSNGRELIDAQTLGIEVSCRIGNCVYPDHFNRGWHITGSTGALGAAAACARLLKLDSHKTTMALGIAASQPIGIQDQFGTMTKPFHPGAAARAGLMSALLAAEGFTASATALEAPRGLLKIYSDKTDWSEITDALGERWEAGDNTYKPFACGIVLHPCIDACIQLHDLHLLSQDKIKQAKVRVHPLVFDVTNKRNPQSGLEGKFSITHAAAIGLHLGKAGQHEFTDICVNNADIKAMRDKVLVEADSTLAETQSTVTVQTVSGAEHQCSVAKVLGGPDKPMTNDQLRAKFLDQAVPVIGSTASQAAWERAMALASLPGIGDLLPLHA
jgi:2-methylcitrate dehydratase PrpD